MRRSLAFALDWLVMALWGGMLFGAVMIATNGNPPRPENAWMAQAIGLLTMTVPVTLYFALCESSKVRASLGKRVLGLVVSRETGERLSFRSALLRNAFKFVPWECGHTNPVVPFAQSVEIEGLYRRAKAPVVLRAIEAPGSHAFWNETRYFPETIGQAVEFFRRHLAKAK